MPIFKKYFVASLCTLGLSLAVITPTYAAALSGICIQNNLSNNETLEVKVGNTDIRLGPNLILNVQEPIGTVVQLLFDSPYWMPTYDFTVVPAGSVAPSSIINGDLINVIGDVNVPNVTDTINYDFPQCGIAQNLR